MSGLSLGVSPLRSLVLVQRQHASARRTGFLATTGFCAAILLPAQSAFAQSAAEEAYLAYADRLSALGLEVSQGPIDYDAATDTLSIPDVSISFAGAFEFPNETDTGGADASTNTTDKITYTLSYTSGTLTITGMAQDGDTFLAQEWINSDDTELLGSLALNGDELAGLDMTLAGSRVENYAFTIPALPEPAADKQASRWLPFVKALMLQSYDLAEVSNISGEMTFSTNSGTEDSEKVTATLEMTGYRASNARDGQIDEYVIESIKQQVETELADGTTLNQATSQGQMTYSGMNVLPIVGLFDPSVPVTGEAEIILETSSTEDYVSEQDVTPDLKASFSMAEAYAKDLTVTKRDVDPLGILDNLLAGKEPDPYTLIEAGVQLYRSFGIAEGRLSDMSFQIPLPDEPDQELGFTIAEAGVTDASAEGIGELYVAGIDAANLPDEAAFKLDRASIGNIDFAPYAGMQPVIKSLVDNAGRVSRNMSPMEIARAFVPSSLSLGLEGLDMTIPGEGEVFIGNFEQEYASSVPPIPTEIYSRTDNASMPLSALNDPQAVRFFDSLGLEKVVWSDETRLYWDETTQDLVLERLMIDVDGVGRAEASMKFANVPKALFEDPENQGQMALIMASFVGAEVTFVDGGVTTEAIDQMAADTGVPPSAMIQALVAQTQAALRQVDNRAFTEEVTNAVAEFLSQPGTLRVSLQPENPVPVAQIAASLISPQILPDLLNVQVTASQ
ncbi:hypothetical protein [Roseibium sp. RKSG952]|uniref:hypothetical protein n=1 Tax=Roseibium sp. RKSG952 TaxID=2529384 RepID=UPI0012BD254D|nr:hypothetical protein [Roseibium sp. RKSG952]MTH95682.1 hypothetical protein [Roseibium sp. RKSG952]